MQKNVIVRQADLKDCGACCLLSIIKYFDGYIPLETIIQDTFTTRLGTTAFHLIEAAKKYGFDAVGLKVDPEKIKEMTFPVIAHLQLENQYSHFVVIYRYNQVKNTVMLMDPAKGIVNINLAEFCLAWTNVIIKLIPASKLPKMAKPQNILNYLINLVPSEKNLIIKLLLTSVIFTLINIITSFYFKISINEINNNNLKTFKTLCIFFLFLTVFKVILSYLKDYYETYLNKNIDLKVMIPFLNHLFSLPLNVINNRTTGEIVTRVQEINEIKDLFSKIFVTIFLDLLLGIASAIFLYSINNKLFFLLLLIIIIYIIAGLIFSPIIYKKIVRNIEFDTKFNNEIIEKVDSFLTLKNMHKPDMVKKQIEYKYCLFLKDTFSFNKLITYNNFVKNFINEVGICLITSFGCYYILKSHLTLIDLITFNSLLVYMLDPIKNIINLLPKINYLKASLNKISEFTNLKEENLQNTNEKFLMGDIVFENLTYTYNNYDYICKNLNLTIKEKQKVMFKGKSGCGKSTLCKLLYRLYDVKEGAIKINNINILDYGLNTIRKNITYLAQKESLFTDTIYNNIVLDQTVSTQRFKMICEICHLEEIVKKKPLRYDTMISDNIANFSGGERQRILLARALLKKSSILILDEALSEVQTDLEKNIIQDICTKFNDKTIIYITHRNLEDLFEQVIDFEELNNGSLL